MLAMMIINQIARELGGEIAGEDGFDDMKFRRDKKVGNTVSEDSQAYRQRSARAMAHRIPLSTWNENNSPV